MSTTNLAWSRSNIPSLVVNSQFCSIPPGGTATGSASDSTRTRGSPARANHSSGARPPKKEAHKATDKGSNRRPSRPEPMVRIHLSPAGSPLRTCWTSAERQHQSRIEAPFLDIRAPRFKPVDFIEFRRKHRPHIRPSRRKVGQHRDNPLGRQARAYVECNPWHEHGSGRSPRHGHVLIA